MKKNAKISIWDLLLWVGAIIIISWALLKMLGVIHSPVWVDMIPYLGGGFSLIGGAYKLGKIMEGIEQTKQKVETLSGLEGKFFDLAKEHQLAMEGKLKIKH